MARQRTIVGLGEAVLTEYPDRIEPSGLGCGIAIQAARFGHSGVVISRIGQDEPARMLVELLRERGVDVSHLQWDPDLPTGRVVVRPVGGCVARYVEARAAFDNLQWDFDLEDVAQQTDAVVYGMLTRRGGQARSEENRFISACGAAIKLFDLTNHLGDRPERGHATSGLEYADAALTTYAALDAVVPGTAELTRSDAAARLMREFDLALVLALAHEGDAVQLTAHTTDDESTTTLSSGRAVLEVAVVAFLHALLRGRAIPDAVALAGDAAQHEAAHPGGPLPVDWTVSE
jgi:sugar/nucleoside kinase (ribokinase family)